MVYEPVARHLRAKVVAGLMTSLALAFNANPARAQSLCVVCTEPQASYRCVVEGAGGAIEGQQLACIKTLAAEGQHATCTVRAKSASNPCDGIEKRVQASSVPALGPAPDDPAAPNPTAVPKKAGGPETVEDALKTMGASTAKQMTKTGEQIQKGAETTSSAVQRSFRCVTSLFTNCGGQ